jgi:small subunit ribosomal protein S21
MITVREGHIESAIRILNREVQKSGVFKEIRLRERYPKASERRKVKRRISFKRAMRYFKKRDFNLNHERRR